MTLDIPDEFKKVCGNLVQGLEVHSPQELMQVALLGVEPRERPAIMAFLDELLSGRYTDDELKDIWWSMPADIVFYEGKAVVTFLTMLRHEVAKSV
ncbi:MAG: hypothetical protein ACKVP3_22220 [Hyphomicrobiaceae bacterium]